MKKIISLFLTLVLVLSLCAHVVVDTKANDSGVTKVASDISKIHIRAGNRILFFLDINDYATAGGTVAVGENRAEYNYLEKIRVYTTEGSVLLSEIVSDEDVPYYNVWGETGSFSIPMMGDEWKDTTITRVEVEAGCQFPSYEYTNNGVTTKNAYVVSEKTVFYTGAPKSDNTSWTKCASMTEVATNVSKIHIRGTNRILFFLTNQDYANVAGTTAAESKAAEYNLLYKVRLYNDTDSALLAEVVGTDRMYYNVWGETGSFSVSLNSEAGFDATTITKVEIEAGCEFPSCEYTVNGSSTKNGYVTANKVTFTSSTQAADNMTWAAEYETTEQTVDTSVSKIHLRNANRLLFFLDTHDYATAGGTVTAGATISEYNYMDKIRIYTETGSALLSEVKGDDAEYYNVWGETGSFSLRLADGWNASNVYKVEIEAGCQFPSYEYTNNASLTKNVYTTTEKVVFTTALTGSDTTNWTREVVIDPTTVDTDITKIHLRNSNRLLFFLSNHDYSEAGSTITADGKISEYNYLDMIRVYTESGSALLSEIVAKDAQYYNVWNETGSFSIAMTDSWNAGTIYKVEVKAGCQFPSYAYTNVANPTVKNVYTTTNDMVFTTTLTGSDTTNWSKEVVLPTSLSKVTGVRTGHNGNIATFTLSVTDYEGAATLQIGEKHKAYNYFEQVMIYAEGQNGPISLGEAFTDEQEYYNMWGLGNTVSLSLNNCTTANLIVIPAGTIFPSMSYTNGEQVGKAGFESKYEKIFVKEGADADGNWVDVSYPESDVLGDANGSGDVSIKDIMRAKHYIKDGYGINVTGDCNEDDLINADDVKLIVKMILENK